MDDIFNNPKSIYYDPDPNESYHISRKFDSIRIHCMYDSQGDIFTISRLKEIKKLYDISQQILFDKLI